MTPELQAWLQTNGLMGGSESDPHNLGDYAQGSTIGNSGLAKRNGESVDDFLQRVYDSSTANGAFGAAGRGFNDMQNAGFFNTLAPVNINGQQSHRVGDNVNAAGYADQLGPKTRAVFNQLGVHGAYDPTYGNVIPEDQYQQMSKAMEQDNKGGFLDNPINLMAIMASMAGGAALAAGGAAGGAAGATGATGAGGASLADSLASAGLMDFSAPGAFGSIASTTPGLSLSPLATASGFSLAPGAGLTFEGMPLSEAWGVNPRLTNFMSQNGSPFDPGENPLSQMNFSSPGEFGNIAETTPGLSLNSLSTASGTSLAPGAGLLGNSSSGLFGDLFKNATSPLGKLLNGTAGGDDYLKLAGSAGSSLLGFLGSESQANAARDVSDKYLALGQPFRAKLAESFSPGFDLSKQDPAFKNALDLSSQSVLKNLSTSGNPFDNPGAVTQAQKYVTDSTALPQLNTYRSQLGSFGQLGTNTAGTADLTTIPNAGNGLDALGYGLGQATGSSNSLEDILKKYGGLLGNKGLGLNLGSAL